MLIKPEIPDDAIIHCLLQNYGLHIAQLAFLPLGGDLDTAVYRADAQDAAPYFCKLRRGDFDEVTVELPKYLSDQGISQIIPPLVTSQGRLWAEVDEYKLILYPFFVGTNGFEMVLTAGSLGRIWRGTQTHSHHHPASGARPKNPNRDLFSRAAGHLQKCHPAS